MGLSLVPRGWDEMMPQSDKTKNLLVVMKSPLQMNSCVSTEDP